MSQKQSEGGQIRGILFDESYALIQIMKNSLKYNLAIAKLMILLDESKVLISKGLFVLTAKCLYVVNSIGTFFSLLLLGNFYSKYDVVYNLFAEGQPVYAELKRVMKFFFRIFTMIASQNIEPDDEEDKFETEEFAGVSEDAQTIRGVRKIFRVIGWMCKTFLFMFMLPIYILFEKILCIRKYAMVLLIVFVLMMYTAGGGLAYNDFFSVYSISLIFVMFLFNNTSISIILIAVLGTLAFFDNPYYFYVATGIDFLFSIVLVSSVMASNIINTFVPRLFQTKLTIQQAFSLDNKSEEEQDKEVLQVTEKNLGFDEDEISMLDQSFRITHEMAEEMSKKSLWRSLVIRMKDHKLSVREIMEIYYQIETLKADILDWFRMKYGICKIDTAESRVAVEERYNELSRKYDIHITKQTEIKKLNSRIFKSLFLALIITAGIYVIAFGNVIFGRGTIAYFSRGVVDLDVSYLRWIAEPYLYYGAPGYAIYGTIYFMLFYIIIQVLGGSISRAIKFLLGLFLLSLIPAVIALISGKTVVGLYAFLKINVHWFIDFFQYLNDVIIKQGIMLVSYAVYYSTYVLHYLFAFIVNIIMSLSMSQSIYILIVWASISLFVALTIGPIVGVKMIKFYRRST